jgi:hypothetical protein
MKNDDVIIEIGYYEMVELLCDFAIFYHKNINKDVSNDAMVFLTDYLKERNKL